LAIALARSCALRADPSLRVSQYVNIHPRPRFRPLAWIAAKAVWVEPMPLQGKLSRDPKDNGFVLTSAAGRAEFLVTQDRDLPVLGKPFGVRIVTPVELIRDLGL
jgi:predicted nucleic acid-binding protein